MPEFNKVVILSNTIEDPYINNKAKLSAKFNATSDYQYINVIGNKQFTLSSGVERITVADAIYRILLDKSVAFEKIDKLNILHAGLCKFIDYDKLLLPRKGEGYINVYAPNAEELAIDYLNSIDRKSEVILQKGNVTLFLSSGQKTFLKIVAYLLSAIEQNSIIFVDEPENFLHPNIEVELVQILHDLLESTKSVAIIATHSSFFAREISSKYISVFKRSGDQYRKIITKPPIETFANDLDTIANFTFGDFDREKLFERVLRDAYPDKQNLETVPESERHNLSLEMLMYLFNEEMVD